MGDEQVSESDLLEQLCADGVTSASATLRPLTGGVSSEIFRVDDGDRVFVVKRALPQLRVTDEWLADVSRNDYEQRYLKYVAGVLPRGVPKVLATGRDYFAMEHLGDEFANWKDELLAGNVRSEDAMRAGDFLGRVHAATEGDHQVAKRFDSTANFVQLRVDPYFITTAQRHPDLRRVIESEANRLISTRECLVHGDYSPKNMLLGPNRLVVVDGEVAWYGDPAFDLAFLISHLLLKSACRVASGAKLAASVAAFRDAYVNARPINSRLKESVEIRTAKLLLMLLLARIDGKSPVEYLDARRQSFVREFARAGLLSATPMTIDDLFQRWFAALETQTDSTPRS